MARSDAKETVNSGVYFAGAAQVKGAGRLAICARRQSGHQQPVAPPPGSGTGTASGSAAHQHGPLAPWSTWPQLKAAPQRVQRLMANDELITV